VTSIWRDRWLTIGLHILVYGAVWVLGFWLLGSDWGIGGLLVTGAMLGFVMGLSTLILRERRQRRRKSRST
jgi:hypothetical protein